ncbi:MAG: YihY family inner membrane protein [Campylobacterota bacterium]|nr:YihY family inner membrane protein [Campylobacterota bacterium]
MMPNKAKILKHTKFWFRVFFDKELTLFSASLSFYTIFTIIPLLLIILTLLTSLDGFSQYYESIRGLIFSNLLPVNSELIMGHIDGFLANAGKMGALGFTLVFFSSLLFFKNFAYIANRIFHAQKRTFIDSFKLYILLLVSTPIALGFFFYITAYLQSLMRLNALTQELHILPLAPYLIIWIFFFAIIQMAPNTKIHLRASLISSFFIAIIFNISKSLFIYYVFASKLYATMYGSFAIVMFLFLWIYISWVIFIYGLKLCYIINRIYKKHEAREK